MNKKKILFVDDEKFILKALQREFIDSNFEMYFADSGESGLTILEKEKIDLVISDIKMPHMDGIKFLNLVKDKYPSVTRLILSGFVEESSVVKSMVSGTASAYFSKPWQPEVLRNKVEKISKTLDMLQDQELLNLIKSIDRLPSLSDIYYEVLEAIKNELEPGEIEAIIKRDPGFTIKILQVVNSAFYSTAKISSIKRAIIILGNNTLKDILLTSAIVDDLNWDQKQSMELNRIFKHSNIVNSVFNEIYRENIIKECTKNLSSIGITHDIGKIILLQFFKDRYYAIREKMIQQPRISFFKHELEMGFKNATHNLIGGYFLKMWNLPVSHVNSALYHHQWNDSPEDDEKFIKILFFINEVCHFVEVKRDKYLPSDYPIEIEGFSADDVLYVENKLMRRFLNED
jgi:HD-like signal output (HDOD) protein